MRHPYHTNNNQSAYDAQIKATRNKHDESNQIVSHVQAQANNHDRGQYRPVEAQTATYDDYSGTLLNNDSTEYKQPYERPLSSTAYGGHVARTNTYHSSQFDPEAARISNGKQRNPSMPGSSSNQVNMN
jgi:hypothetical protein